jgi:hypothetical protein
MRRLVASTALLALCGCFDQSTPSSFTPPGPDAGSTDGASGDGHVGNLLGDGGGVSSFPCGPTFCPTTTYCLTQLSDAGAEVSEDCYPFLLCKTTDCACLSGVVQTAYCDGGHITCNVAAGTILSCAP